MSTGHRARPAWGTLHAARPPVPKVGAIFSHLQRSSKRCRPARPRGRSAVPQGHGHPARLCSDPQRLSGSCPNSQCNAQHYIKTIIKRPKNIQFKTRRLFAEIWDKKRATGHVA